MPAMIVMLSKCCNSVLYAANIDGTKARCAACGKLYDIADAKETKEVCVLHPDGCPSCMHRETCDYIKQDKWTQLRNWLTNLSNQTTTKKRDKIGIKIALQMMDRLEEAESK